MKVLTTSLMLFLLSLGAFALDGAVTLRFLLKNSISHFETEKQESESHLRGTNLMAALKDLTEGQVRLLGKMKIKQTCKLDAYNMLLDISKLYQKEDALSSAFVTRTELALKGDKLLSLYDFFIHPYLEYFNYKSEFLTAAVNKQSFLSDESMPFFVSELNVEGYCDRQMKLDYGQNEELELTFPESLIVNDVDRSKRKFINREISALKEYESQSQPK